MKPTYRISVCTLAWLAAPLAAQEQLSLDPLKDVFGQDPNAAPTEAAIGDMNGDGLPDVVFPGPRVVLNRGSRFDPLGAATASDRSLTLADIDGDGDLDLAVGGMRRIELFVNDGQGNLQDQSDRRVPKQSRGFATHIAFADLDGDGDLDLATSSGMIQINDGTGVFDDETEWRIPDLGFALGAIAIGDVDGDSDQDLFLLSGLYLNDGSGRFAPGEFPFRIQYNDRPQLVDVERDGDIDVIIASASPAGALFINHGLGKFERSTNRLPNDPASPRALVAAADLDGDRFVDLVYSVGRALPPEPGLVWYPNDGSGRFANAQPRALPISGHAGTRVVAGDLDGNADIDLIALSSMPFAPSFARALFNDGTGTFLNGNAHALGLWASGLHEPHAVDVDGDGDEDVLQPHGVAINDGQGQLIPLAGAFPQGAFGTSSAIGDFDGDGDVDMIAVIRPAVRLLLNDGHGTYRYADAGTIPSLDDAAALAAIDLEGDGDLDIVFANRTHAWENDGNGRFREFRAFDAPALGDAVELAIGDLDRDGDDDVLIGVHRRFGASDAQCRVAWNDGGGRFTTTTVATGLRALTAMQLADLDGDGLLDVALTRSSYLLGQLRNDGRGGFVDVSAELPTTSGYHTVLDDVDLDGDVDWIVGRERPILLVNDGRGRFAVDSPRVDDRAEPRSWTSGILTIDLDADGDRDVLHAGPARNRQGHQLFAYTNRLRGMRVPGMTRQAGELRVELSAVADGSTFAVPLLSDRRAHVPLGPIGVLRIDLTRSVPLPSATLDVTARVREITVTVPDDSALTGVQLYLQTVFVRNGAARLSGVLSETVLGTRPN